MEKLNNFEKSVNDLIRNGYGIFDTNLTKIDFQRCMNPMKILTGLNPGLKYCTDPENIEPDRGLFYRNKEEGKDNKWCFHYRESLATELRKKLGEGEWSNELICYLNNSRFVFEKILNLSIEIVKAVDKKIPRFGLYNLYTDPRSRSMNLLRNVQYDAPEEDLNVAGEHFDRSLITLCGYENHPGLYIEENGKKIPYLYQEGKVLVFWGRKAASLTNGRLKKVKHGVDVFEKDIQRDAIPFFGHTYRPEIL